ncbi:MAG TPA: AMP-binding protein [Rhodanobacteraceae bacterium]|nr:AMP-binding protein [Rhodanobacteraceae bacterium]
MIGSLLGHWARYHPQKTALVCDGERISFAQHHERVARCAAALHTLGLRRGDAIATFIGNCAELVELYRACALLGLVTVPVSPLLQAAGVAVVLRDSGAVAIFSQPSLQPVLDALRAQFPHLAADRWIMTGPGGGYAEYAALVAAAPRLDSAEATDPEAPFNIMYSSGTTGAPKGIVLTQRIRKAYALQFAAAFAVRADSVVMHAGSLVFNGAFTTLMPAWLQGCTYVLCKHFAAAEFIDTVHRESVTHVMLVPSQIAAILTAPNFSREALASLKMVCSLGAPLPHEHRQRLQEVLPGAIYELYGLTEGFATVLDGADTAAHPGTVGIPLPFHELRIVDADGVEVTPGSVGEITGRGPLLMPGYHRQPELTGRAIVEGWLRTGDLGFVDADGFLHLVDRAKDMIISGGVNVYPRDIEEVACRHPAVLEAAVFGVPDQKWGERPVAAVLLRPGMSVDAQALCTWINANVAARFQRVHEVAFCTEFPRNVAGKTLKRELRERWSAAQT